MKKIEEEGFGIIEYQYEAIEYDSCGKIIHIHNNKKWGKLIFFKNTKYKKLKNEILIRSL